jgi:hypothetical protein
VPDSVALVRGGLTEEDLALLGHSDLTEDDLHPDYEGEYGSPAPVGYRERLALGDLSWA